MRPVKMDYGHRKEYVNWLLERQHENDDFFDKIFFSDEVHFQIDGFVKWQIFSQENPLLINEKQIHPPRVTAWCVFWPENGKMRHVKGKL